MNQHDILKTLEALHRRIDEQEALIRTFEGSIKSQIEGEARWSSLFEGLKHDVMSMSERFARLEVVYAEVASSLAGLTEESRGALFGYESQPEGVPEDETDEQRATRVGLIARVVEIEGLVRGRNRSAPTKRSMTDEDARRVLIGDQKDEGHKEAGEAIGLTYAQVYSCRLMYTFKHVHKELRDSGWKNPWAQKK